jgi:hypothetical protein
MKKLCLFLLVAGTAVYADTISYGSLLDPAPDAFCTDATHPVCLKLINVQFSNLSQFPADVVVEDRNGDFTIYSFHNVVVNVDPGGLTYSGSVTPDEAFSLTSSENTDFLGGFLYLGTHGAGNVDLAGVNVAATPEPGSAGLLLAGLVGVSLAGRRLLRRKA